MLGFDCFGKLTRLNWKTSPRFICRSSKLSSFVIVQLDTKYSRRLLPILPASYNMKMSIATIAVALVYLMSIVVATHQPNTMMMSDKNDQTVLSTSERMQLAQTIKEMVANNPDAGAASTMSTEDLFGMLSSIMTNPAVLSNAAGIISAASRGDTSALAGHVVGLLGSALPAVVPMTPAVETPAPMAAPMTPEAPDAGMANTSS